MHDKIFTVLGGDRRQLSVVARLAAVSKVRVFGLPPAFLPADILYDEDWRAAASGADVLLLPLPASPDGVRISCPLLPEITAPMLTDLLKVVKPGATVFGGRLTPAFKEHAQDCNVALVDYSESDAFQVKNALPTAEGAVEILMRESDRVIFGMPVAITGFGRIGRALARLLIAMGAEVTVAARRNAALLEAAQMGCRTVALKGEGALFALCREKYAIFNTVPHWIFTREVLHALPKNQILIDLASSPGGVDAALARACDRRVIYALSLPGKYAPQTAGEIIAEAVLSAVEGEG